MKIRALDAKLIRELCSYRELIPLMRKTLAAVSRGQSRLPLRTALRLPEEQGALVMMPGYLGSPTNFAGIKLISLVQGSSRAGRPSHQGLMLLYEANGLEPVGLLCGSTLTAMRTAAATACATDVLAVPDARILAMLGSGEQAEAHLEALPLVRQFKEIRLWSRTRANAEALASRCAARGQNVQVCDSVQTTVAGADVICTVTSAPTPILFGRDVAGGMHVNLVGSSGADAAEVDDDLTASARYFVDYRESALNQAGELLGAMRRGRLTADHIVGELGEVIERKCDGRRSPADLTVYKSLGIAAQDIAMAAFACEKAARLQVGQSVSI